MPLDEARFPRTVAYLRTVPGGFDAYPDCQTAADYARMVQIDFPELWRDAHLPPAIATALSRPWRDDEFIPSAHLVTQGLIVRDRLMPDDAVYERRVYERAAKMFARPMYRMMSHVFSPTIFLMGVTRHWATAHKGDLLRSRGGDRASHQLELEHPALMYPLCSARAHGVAFTALLNCTGAKDVTLEVTQPSPTLSRYRLTWVAKGA